MEDEVVDEVDVAEVNFPPFGDLQHAVDSAERMREEVERNWRPEALDFANKALDWQEKVKMRVFYGRFLNK